MQGLPGGSEARLGLSQMADFGRCGHTTAVGMGGRSLGGTSEVLETCGERTLTGMPSLNYIFGRFLVLYDGDWVSYEIEPAYQDFHRRTNGLLLVGDMGALGQWHPSCATRIMLAVRPQDGR